MTSLKNDSITQAYDKNELVSQLRELGVREGMVLEVHSSLSSIGYVIGGSQTVVDALQEAVGFDGTLVMAIQNCNNTEPANWINPPADRKLWEKIRTQTPAYKPDESDFPYMSQIAQNLNRRAGAYRSYHPSCGFVTYGKYGKLIAHEQSLDYPLGEDSPLGAMYQLPSYILLIGVGYDKATGMHLGEYRSNTRSIILNGGAIEQNGYRRWVEYYDLELDSEDFPEIGQLMEQQGMVKTGALGESECRLFRFADAVDFTANYLQKKEEQ